MNNNDTQKFDQMKFNEDNFGLTDDYDENNYTTKLEYDDYSAADIKNASKLADSIKQSDLKGDLKNRHMMEERGLVGYGEGEADNEDEEALYSAVIRPELKGKIHFFGLEEAILASKILDIFLTILVQPGLEEVPVQKKTK